MTVNQEWDISTISPSQWSKLLGEAAHEKGNKHLYWNGGRCFKYLQDPPSQGDYHLMSVTELWNFSQKIFTQNSAYRQESRMSGGDLLRNFKMLLSAEDERIKTISGSVFPQAEHKELEGLKTEINDLETSLKPTPLAGSIFFIDAVQKNDEAAIKRWIMFGADLNKVLHTGETPLSYVLSNATLPNIVQLLLNDSDVFIRKHDSYSPFEEFLCDYLLGPSSDEQIILSMFRNKFLEVSDAEKPIMMRNINKALAYVFLNNNTAEGKNFITDYLFLVEELSTVGANINTILKQLGFSKWNSKLMYSAWKGDLEAVKKILTPRTKTFLGNAKDNEGNTALIWAVRMGHLDVVKYLVKAGVDLNAKNIDGHRALVYAVHNDKRNDIRAFLREAGAKDDSGKTFLISAILDGEVDSLKIDSLDPRLLNARDDNGNTALHYAAMRGNNHLVEQLIKRGANINAINNGGNTALIGAVMTNHMEAVKQLMSAGADLNVKNRAGKRAYDIAEGEMKTLLDNAGAKDKSGANVLMRAVAEGNENRVDELIAQGFNLDAQSDAGTTALSFAILAENFAIGEKLLKARANVKLGRNFEGTLDLTILHFDSTKIRPEIIQWAETLIKYGAKIESTSELIFAIWRGDIEAVSKMINSSDIYLDGRTKLGHTAITFAIRMRQPAIVKLLIDAHADVNLDDPIRIAIARNEPECLDLLLQAKANVNIKYYDQTTALHLAIEKGLTNMADKLIKAGADKNATNSSGDTPLQTAIKSKNKDAVELLLKAKVDLDVQNNEGQTALHLAVQYNYNNIVEQLIFSKANLNLRDRRGYTPLHKAVLGNKEAYTLLLENKANPNLKNNDGNTPLSWAAILGSKDFVDLLIKHGADIDAVNNTEMTTVSFLHDKLETWQRQLAAGNQLQQYEKERIPIYKDIINKLIAAGARDIQDRTPLMRAVLNPSEKEAYSQVQEWLSRKKEDVNATDYLGMSAAILASKEGYVNLLKLLMQADADLLIQDKEGHTALYHALFLGKKDVIAHLLGKPLSDKLSLLFPTIQDIFKADSVEKIVKNLPLIFPSTPSEKGEILLLPFLLRDRKMTKILMKALTPEEKQFGLDFLAKNHPKANLNWFTESEIEFHPSHYKNVVEVVIPPAPKGVNLDSLLHMFDQINTVEPRKPGYLHPKQMKNDTAPMTLVEIKASLELMVTRVKNKTKAFQATPPAGSVLLVEFYTKVENAIAHIIIKLSDPSIDPDVKTSALVNLAIAGSYCAARYKTEPAYWYERLTHGIEALTLEQEIGKISQDTRNGVVENMVRKASYPDGKRIPIPNRPHTHNQIVRTIGPKYGITGVSETFEDPDFKLGFLNEKLLEEQFLRAYSPTTIIDRIDAAINGVVEDGKMVPGSRELELIVVDSWLKDHIKEAALSTSVEIDGVERTLDYPTFIQTVNTAFEAEKKRLSGLSDEEIVKDGHARIKEFLLGKYGLKFGDEVNLKDWNQVQKSIQIQSPKLKGGSRLEQPDTLAAIEVYIKKLTGRQNYTDFVLSALLNKKFGIAGVSSSQNWESVKQVIENRFRQEYVDTQIRKGGIIPRSTIVNMLLDMQVLDVA